ncbi:MAG TPA: hypothetical protein VMD92_18195 [Acidobacteriaceae bacterium]|jgi:hypothetical protein|nr:hypothetical protein [Acidobacteriaceae bacterium]
MNRWQIATALIAGLLAAATPAIAQNEGQGQGQAVVTVLPKNDKQPTADVSGQTLSVQVNGKRASLTNWQPMRGDQATVEFVLLIDGAAHTSLGREWDEIEHFVQTLPPNVKVAIAYMENGRAVLTGPLTTDHAKALQGLRLTAGVPGYSASPYFCLSNLARSWPSTDPTARREVLMITDGVDTYERVYDPEDPYVHSAIVDSARAGLVVYSIYWLSNGRADRSWYENDAGQNLLLQVDEATGGTSYWEGTGNPVTLTPYFDDLSRRWKNQYELSFSAPLKGKADIATFKVKTTTPNVKVDAPQQVLVSPVGSPRQ